MKRLLHGNMHHEHIEHRKIGQEYNTKKQYILDMGNERKNR
jgi:hypothetical protein